jgi:hypothetical protein
MTEYYSKIANTVAKWLAQIKKCLSLVGLESVRGEERWLGLGTWSRSVSSIIHELDRVVPSGVHVARSPDPGDGPIGLSP